MGMIKGIDIILYQKVAGPSDPFGNPTYTEEAETVNNVLVSPVSSADAAETYKLNGRVAVYQLCIPKRDTHEWSGAVVEIWGEKFRVIGMPMRLIDSMVPLSWNKKVQVERYE